MTGENDDVVTGAPLVSEDGNRTIFRVSRK
jgi:hypothetical protein